MSKGSYRGRAPHAKVSAKVRRIHRDVVYHSLAEKEFAQILGLEIRAGNVAHVVRQVPFQLGPDFSWKADFVCFSLRRDAHAEPFVEMVVHEVKGVNTTDFRTVRRLWPKYGPCDLVVHWTEWGKWTKVETIKGAQRPGGGDGD